MALNGCDGDGLALAGGGGISIFWDLLSNCVRILEMNSNFKLTPWHVIKFVGLLWFSLFPNEIHNQIASVVLADGCSDVARMEENAVTVKECNTTSLSFYSEHEDFCWK